MIRVSCVMLCRIQHPDGRLLLGLNKNRLQQGERIFTSYGGACTFDDAEPLRALGARLERDDVPDLRFFIDESQLPNFEAWFRARAGRETEPFRELYEELVAEEELLAPFETNDVNTEYLGLVTGESKSTW